MTQAYAFGYSKLFNNMLSALNKIQNGYLTLSDASKALFKVKPDDSQCRFESMIDENAVYVCPGSFVIALKEEKDVNYIQGTQLPAGYYILTGTKTSPQFWVVKNKLLFSNNSLRYRKIITLPE